MKYIAPELTFERRPGDHISKYGQYFVIGYPDYDVYNKDSTPEYDPKRHESILAQFKHILNHIKTDRDLDLYEAIVFLTVPEFRSGYGASFKSKLSTLIQILDEPYDAIYELIVTTSYMETLDLSPLKIFDPEWKE